MSKSKSSGAAKSARQAQTVPDLTDDVRAKTGKNEAREQAASKGHKQDGGRLSEMLAKIEDFKNYLLLSRAELRKVSWPNLKETRATSLVVFGFVAIMAILLSLVDLLFSSVIRMILP